MRIFVINLEQSTERWKSISSQLNKYNLEFERFNAILGSSLSKCEKKEYFNSFRWWCAIGRPIRDGELGCNVSHYLLLKKIVNDKLPYALICEDDVLFNECLPEVLNKLEKYINPSDNSVYLLSNWTKNKNVNWEIIPSTQNNSAEAYIVTAVSAKNLLQANFPIEVPCDHWQRFIKKNLVKVYNVFPEACKKNLFCFGSFTTEGEKLVKDFPLWKFILHKIKRLIGKTIDKQYINKCKNDNILQWLSPINRGGYQFFREWLTEVWENNGGKIKRDLNLPWKFKMLIGKLNLCHSIQFLPKFSNTRISRKLIICVGGRIDYYAWPWCYFFEIIPIIWDCWPKYWPILIKNINNMKIKKVFCTSRQTAEYIRNNIEYEISAIWLPEGIKSELYPMGPKLIERNTDIMQFGRDIKGKLRYLTHDSFTAALRDAKIVTCYPRCDTNPEQAGNLETLTQRYWECMLSGCLIVGRAPSELIDLIGYNPVVEHKMNDVDIIMKELIPEINKYQN